MFYYNPLSPSVHLGYNKGCFCTNQPWCLAVWWKLHRLKHINIKKSMLLMEYLWISYTSGNVKVVAQQGLNWTLISCIPIKSQVSIDYMWVIINLYAKPSHCPISHIPLNISMEFESLAKLSLFTYVNHYWRDQQCIFDSHSPESVWVILKHMFSMGCLDKWHPWTTKSLSDGSGQLAWKYM